MARFSAATKKAPLAPKSRNLRKAAKPDTMRDALSKFLTTGEAAGPRTRQPRAAKHELDAADYMLIRNMLHRASREQLMDLNHTVVDLIRHKAAELAITFKIGQKVEWDSQKRGEVMRGVVTKVNRRTIKVKTDKGMPWRVSPVLLRPLTK